MENNTMENNTMENNTTENNTKVHKSSEAHIRASKKYIEKNKGTEAYILSRKNINRNIIKKEKNIMKNIEKCYKMD